MNAETEQSTEPTVSSDGAICAMLNAVVDAVLLVDQTESIEGANAAAEAMLGEPMDAIVGARLPNLLPPLLPIGALCARGRDGVSIDVRTASGAIIPAQVVAQEVSGPSGARYVVVVRDRRGMERALEGLLRAHRLAAVDSAMSSLTHDTRNILQHMQSCLTLIALRGNDDVKALAADLQEAQDRLQRLFEDARSLAAPVRLERRLADVRKIIERAWRALRLRWSKKAITLALEAERCPDPRVSVDPGLLGQALRTVLERAIDAAPEDGTVVCSLRRESGGQLEIELQHAGATPASELDGQAFDIDRQLGGAGVPKPLAMAQKLINEHDGDLRIDAGPSGGSRLIIRLPHPGVAS